jgi:hypothetical protein
VTSVRKTARSQRFRASSGPVKDVRVDFPLLTNGKSTRAFRQGGSMSLVTLWVTKDMDPPPPGPAGIT